MKLINKFKKLLSKKFQKFEIKTIEHSLVQSSYSKSFYSQDGEDAVLAAFYSDDPSYQGFYIDLGALHPFRFSNTQYFYEKGWRGINIDATPGSMDAFKKARPEDINLEIAISSRNKKLKYFCFAEPALNSFNQILSLSRIKKGWKLIKTTKIETTTINTILDKYLPIGKKIDFINLDIEGLELEVLESLDWDKYSPEYFLIEDLTLVDTDIFRFKNTELYKILYDRGYFIAAKSRRTLILKKSVGILTNELKVDRKFDNAVNILSSGYALKTSMSANSCIDISGKPIPWYTYPSIEYLKQLDLSGKKIFEYGSGNSSLFWANRAKKVISVESNGDWYKNTSKIAPKNLNIIFEPGTKEYIHSISTQNLKFDVIIIDGLYRKECSEIAVKYLTKGGLIILDNSDRASEIEAYKEAILILRNADLIQVDFMGFGPINDYTWSTSLFFSRNFKFKPKHRHIQPTKTIGNISELS